MLPLAVLVNELPHLRFPLVDTDDHGEFSAKPADDLEGGLAGTRDDGFSGDDACLFQGGVVEAGNGDAVIASLACNVGRMGDRAPDDRFGSASLEVGNVETGKVKRNDVDLYIVTLHSCDHAPEGFIVDGRGDGINPEESDRGVGGLFFARHDERFLKDNESEKWFE